MKHRIPVLLTVTALTLSGCAASPEEPAPLPTLSSSAATATPAPPAETAHEHTGGTADEESGESSQPFAGREAREEKER